MSAVIWQTSHNGSNWTDMPTPNKFDIDWEDLDKDSFRSVMTGDLNRTVIRRRWSKVAMSFDDMSEADCGSMLAAVNQDVVYFRFRSPAFGTSGYIAFIGYVSKMKTSTELVDKGWNVSFDVVQEKGASFQS